MCDNVFPYVRSKFCSLKSRENGVNEVNLLFHSSLPKYCNMHTDWFHLLESGYSKLVDFKPVLFSQLHI
jgi:hypothetical protein